MFSFLWPFIAFILPLPWILRHILKPVPKQETPAFAIYVPFFKRLESQNTKDSIVLPQKTKIWAVLGWFLLVLSCMRPTWLGDPVALKQSAHNIILAMDVSGSMSERDFTMNLIPQTRLDMLKKISDDFILGRKGDNLGLVIFGSEAYTHAPLSPDIKTLRELVSEIGLGIAGDQTALGEALALAVRTASSVPADSQIVILLSDGYSNAGQLSPEEAIKLAKNQNIKVYTVGIGSDAKTVRSFMGNFQINPSLDLDEATLKKISDETGGKYFRAKSVDDMKNIYTTIDQLNPIMKDTDFIRPQKGLFYIPLALALLFFGIVLYQKRRSS